MAARSRLFTRRTDVEIFSKEQYPLAHAECHNTAATQVLRVAKSNPEKLHEIVGALTTHCIKVSSTSGMPDVAPWLVVQEYLQAPVAVGCYF